MVQRWTHDCLRCQYLGTVIGPDPDSPNRDHTWDLYWCAGAIASEALGGSLIARYGSEGSHYLSSIVSVIKRDRGQHPALLWALALKENKP